MKIRGIRPFFVLLFLLAVCLAVSCFAVNVCETPLLPHPDPSNEREFQNAYQCITESPLISVSSNTPTAAPGKIGNMFINTTTGKVYVGTGTSNSGQWAILN